MNKFNDTKKSFWGLSPAGCEEEEEGSWSFLEERDRILKAKRDSGK